MKEQLTHLYNISFQNSSFPKAWAKATVTPLQKKGDASLVTNLRPISILPVVGKLQEKLAHKYLSDFLEKTTSLENINTDSEKI